METKPEKELTPLSASRIKTYTGCSYSYYCNYILRIPGEGNLGSLKGIIIHSVLEMFLLKNRKEIFDKIISNGTVTCYPPLVRLIKYYIKKNKLEIPTESFNHIDEMIVTAFKTDFFVDGGRLIGVEWSFDITNQEPRFRIKGFLDKLHIKDDKIIISDYKSSKKKYTGEDKDSNLQALIYSLATKKTWPDLNPIVKFIFLQFKENPIMEIKFEYDALLGLQYYLAEIQKNIDNFDEKSAMSNFAYDKPSSSDEFCGKSLCGFDKYPGQLNKDGLTKTWGCQFKWGFDYYILLNKENKIIKSSKNLNDLKPKDGERIEKKRHEGCPKFRQSLDDFVSITKKNINPLDDF